MSRMRGIGGTGLETLRILADFVFLTDGRWQRRNLLLATPVSVKNAEACYLRNDLRLVWSEGILRMTPPGVACEWREWDEVMSTHIALAPNFDCRFRMAQQ